MHVWKYIDKSFKNGVVGVQCCGSSFANHAVAMLVIEPGSR